MSLLRCEESAYGGWSRGLHLFTDEVELWVSLEVGPRILRCQRRGKENLFYEDVSQLGGRGEPSFRLRGGHRFWTAPESPETYEADNSEVAYVVGKSCVELVAPPQFGLRKTLLIESLSPSLFRVRHGLHNVSSLPIARAPWALSVMAPSGVALLPQPPLRAHPSSLPAGTPWHDEDLLPHRRLVLWPYTDLGDPRLQLSGRLWTVEQRRDRPPLKLGLYDQSGGLDLLGCVAGYQLGSSVFVKSVPVSKAGTYPDLGASFELYTDGNFLELETLGPMQTLLPDETCWHDELWLVRESVVSLRDEALGLSFLTDALRYMARHSRSPE